MVIRLSALWVVSAATFVATLSCHPSVLPKAGSSSFRRIRSSGGWDSTSSGASLDFPTCQAGGLCTSARIILYIQQLLIYWCTRWEASSLLANYLELCMKASFPPSCNERSTPCTGVKFNVPPWGRGGQTTHFWRHLKAGLALWYRKDLVQSLSMA